jgi:hypothetical protein
MTFAQLMRGDLTGANKTNAEILCAYGNVQKWVCPSWTPLETIRFAMRTAQSLTEFHVRPVRNGTAICAALAENAATLVNLTMLDVSRNFIGDAGAASLVALVNLTTLDVSNNYIGPAGAASLATLVNLTTLKVRGNDIGGAGAASLVALVNLTTLDASLNNIGDAGAASLAALVNLTTLDVSKNRIRPEGAASLDHIRAQGCEVRV